MRNGTFFQKNKIENRKGSASGHLIKKIKVCAALLIIPLALSACGKKKDASLLGQGMAAIKTMDYSTALELFQKAQDAGEDYQQVKRGQGIANMGLFNYEDAIDDFESSLKSAGWRIGALEKDTNYYLAAAFEKSGDNESALGVYDAILDMWPREEQARTQRGLVYLKNGDYESAKEDFDRVINDYPKDYDNLIEIYKALESTGYAQMGTEYLSTALNEQSDDMSGYDKGRFNYYLGEYDKARNFLEAERDTGAGAILYLGLSYEALGDFNYATSVYQSFIASKKGDAIIYNQLGVCELKMGAYQEAYDHFSRGLEMEDASCHQSLLYNRICACEYMGDFNKAKSLIGDYLSQYPDDEEAQREQLFLSTR